MPVRDRTLNSSADKNLSTLCSAKRLAPRQGLEPAGRNFQSSANWNILDSSACLRLATISPPRTMRHPWNLVFSSFAVLPAATWHQTGDVLAFDFGNFEHANQRNDMVLEIALVLSESRRFLVRRAYSSR